jgi:GNAT superfamily N-acetyltransferase
VEQATKIVNDGNDPSSADDLLNPATEAAKIRSFYVHPDRARLGIGSRLLRASEEAAQRAGFRRLELIATLTGAQLYAARGWRTHERLEIPLPDGQTYPAIRMTKTVEDPSGQAHAA